MELAAAAHEVSDQESNCLRLLLTAGPQSLFGYQLARNGQAAVALAAGVGADLPVHCTAWLRDTIGADVTGLTATDGRPTPRAWQVFEADGRRTQVTRNLLRFGLGQYVLQ